MTLTPKVLAVGVADEIEVAGTSGVHANWEELGAKPLGTGKLYTRLFGRVDDTYRRLDRQSKAIVMAAAATGIDDLLTHDEREGTALVTETVCGSIEVDLRYTSVMAQGYVHGAIFPYTLQSTCIGDVALRHELRGATLCLSIEPEERGAALREAWRMIQGGEVQHVLLATVDALAAGLPSLDAKLRAVAAVVAAPSVPGGEPVATWPADVHAAGGDVFDEWAAAARAACAR